MLTLKNLSCNFQAKKVLQNISLNIPSHLTILGANGSGKSTLAKVMSGLVAFEGEVLIDEKPSKSFSSLERAKLLSYIPAKLESYDAFLSVEEFVLLGRFAYKESFFDYSASDKALVKENLEFLGITHLAKHSLDSLSSGEQQLTLIAQALVQESQIIIFDEPTANLDPKNSALIAKHIKALQQEHQVLLITHDLALAEFMHTPILFMQKESVQLFEKNFFNDERLSRSYAVEFKKGRVVYA